MRKAASLFCFVLTLFPGLLPAAPVEVPAGQLFVLPSGPLLFKLDDAEISFQWDAEKEAGMIYSVGEKGDPAPPSLSFLRRRLSPSEILRTPGGNTDAGKAPENIVLDLHLLPGQILEIRGEQLNITTTAPEPSATWEDRESGEGKDEKMQEQETVELGNGAFPLRLDLRRSTLSFENLSLPGSIKAEESSLEILHPLASLFLQTKGGDLRIIRAAAPIELEAEESTILLDSDNTINMTLNNAHVSMSGAFSSLKCEAVDSYLDFYQTGGKLDISGSGSTFRMSEVHFGRCEIRGEHHNIFVKGRGQLFRTLLSSSSVDIPQWKGRIETTLKGGSSFELESQQGDLLFNISDGSELRLKGITGHLRGQSHDSSMVFSRLKSMEVDIWGSRLKVSALGEITKLNAFASECEISAPELKTDPLISLYDDSSLELEMPAPCVIELKDPMNDWTSVIDAPNCGMKINGQLSGNLSRAHRGGPRPIQAEVSIDDSSSLRVEVPL